MNLSIPFTTLLASSLALCLSSLPASASEDHLRAARELERAIHLEPNLENGKKVYLLCAVCHEPEAWGNPSGEYPQLAGQHPQVIIKQLADIRARNRDNPTMYPFTLLDHLTLQQLADVSAYIAQFPMTTENGIGPGDDLEHGRRLYAENCEECHGAKGEGIANDHMPLIQGQHYRYLVRQFEWIKNGKRRNADNRMIEQIEGFSPRDIHAVMDYTSRLAPPPGRMAAADYRNPDFPQFWRPILPSSVMAPEIAREN